MMEPDSNHEHGQESERFNPWVLVRFALSLPIFFALFLFVPAGTWSWERGWLFVVVLTAAMLVAGVAFWRVNPDIYVARSRFRSDTKRWDKILLPFLSSALLAVFPVAALDDGRFHWFPVPWWVVGLGYFLFLVGFSLVVWAQAVNKFFELTVRIQMDRGQKVIDSGPYAIVRHPGYVGIVLFVGIALCLGSLWALIPVGIAFVLLIVRTRWEDETLQAELLGYKEYTQRVRYRLIPGVW
jgi:protein-S-isoprenylcysteine O-methyltransferase Ste14